MGLRRRSQALFGNQHRLAVAVLAATAAEDELYARRIAERAGIADEEARRQIDRLRQAGLLEAAAGPPPTPHRRGRRPDYLRRLDDDAWRALEGLGRVYRRGS